MDAWDGSARGWSRARWLGHVAYWAAALAFYTLYFGQREGTYGQSLIFVALLLPITVATTYFLIYWLIPRYLLTRRYAVFAVYFCYTLILSVYLELLLVTVLFVTVAGYQAMVVQPGVADLLDVLAGMYLVVFLAVALHLLKRWYAMQAAHARLERARLEAELRLKEAELKLLKAQLHPHFLFNTLNNLYALTLERSDRAPDVVLRISDLLDYMLYRGNEARVPLADEIAHLRNYLALERLRYGDRVRVAFETAGEIAHAAVAPLLLIPFVENSFKHGVSRSRTGGEVCIRLAVKRRRMRFEVENSRGPQDAAGDPEGSAGIGLANVRRRLELLYPGAHRLDVEETPGRYRILLSLELDERDEPEAGNPDEDALPPRR